MPCGQSTHPVWTGDIFLCKTARCHDQITPLAILVFGNHGRALRWRGRLTAIMDSGQATANSVEASSSSRPVLIAAAFYRNEALVEELSASLLRCAADIAAISGEIVFFNDSPDYQPLSQALSRAAVLLSTLSVRVEQNPANLGFVKTMNRAIAEAVASGMDLIMLNSDTVIEPGAITEMLWAAQQDVMHGFVNPRSDNATIATLPLHDRLGGRRGRDAVQIFASYAKLLPRLSYVPTAVGFCMFVRWEILAELGGFDEVYGKGYNEENDLVMRASRLGYRAVLANRAFVAHVGEASFSAAPTTRNALEQRNRAILDGRYPEYAVHTRRHYDTPEVIAEQLLACLVPDQDGKLDAAIDCSSFTATHNGTMQAGRQTIAAVAQHWRDRYRVHVLCSEEVFAFHDLARLGTARADPHGGKVFAVVFRIGQPYDWNTLQRLCLAGAVLGIYMLDTISLDWPRLASPRLQNLWQFTMDHFDMMATQSRQTDRAIRLRMRVPDRMVCVVSPHSLDLHDYGLAGTVAPAETVRLVVIGNHYDHKYVAPTANALARAFTGREVTALGMTVDPALAAGEEAPSGALMNLPNLSGLLSGALEDATLSQLYAEAAAVIFPSYAEGFGFPTLNALAARRPLFARRLPVTEEIWRALGCSPNVHFFETTDELIEKLRTVPSWQPEPPQPGQDRLRPAREIRSALEAAMQAVTYETIVARVQAMQFASDAGNLIQTTALQDADIAAGLVAARLEALARRAFRQKLVFKAARLAVRSVRRLRGVGRKPGP